MYLHLYIHTSYLTTNLSGAHALTIWDPLSVTMVYQGMNLVLGRRIGMAKRCFLEPKSLEAFFMIVGSEGSKFKHKPTIESKLMYSLSCLCLSSKDRRRLDGFQNRCWQKVFSASHLFISPECLIRKFCAELAIRGYGNTFDKTTSPSR